MNRRIAVPTLALGGVTLAAAGLIAGLLLSPDPVAAASNDESDSVSDLPAVTETFDDRRQVPFAPLWGQETSLTVIDTGRVTRSTCQVGQPITSGTSPVTVDDRPALALATAIPLWRDLGPGSRGDDVFALQEELQRLGFPIEPNGFYGETTRVSVRDLLTEAGQLRPTGSLPIAQVIWLPDAQVVPADCPLTVGSQSNSAPFATTDSQLVGLQASGGLDGAVPGARTVRLNDLSAPVDNDGRITDPVFLDAVVESGWLNPELGLSSVDLDFALATPLSVTVVPASALFGLSGDSGCILVDGTSQRVQVVASRLGRTMLNLDATVPAPSVVGLPSPGQICQ